MMFVLGGDSRVSRAHSFAYSRINFDYVKSPNSLLPLFLKHNELFIVNKNDMNMSLN